MKCLLVKTSDKRKFLTSCRNLESLREFCSNLGAELLTVDAKGRHRLLSLEELAELICNPHHKPDRFDYTVLSGNPDGDRASITAKRDRITSVAKRMLASGKTVSVKRLSVTMNASEAQVRACIRRAAELLQAKLSRISPGEYRRA